MPPPPEPPKPSRKKGVPPPKTPSLTPTKPDVLSTPDQHRNTPTPQTKNAPPKLYHKASSKRKLDAMQKDEDDASSSSNSQAQGNTAESDSSANISQLNHIWSSANADLVLYLKPFVLEINRLSEKIHQGNMMLDVLRDENFKALEAERQIAVKNAYLKGIIEQLEIRIREKDEMIKFFQCKFQPPADSR